MALLLLLTIVQEDVIEEIKDLNVSKALQENNIPTKTMKTLICSPDLYTRVAITLMFVFSQHHLS